LNAGIKKFGKSGRKAALDETKQIHNRLVICPINVDNIPETDRMNAILVKERCGWIKARTCAYSSTQHESITKVEVASLTLSHEELITGAIDAKIT